MPQVPLTDDEIRTYIFLEKTIQNLTQKIRKAQNTLNMVSYSHNNAVTAKMRNDILLLQQQLQDITTQFSAYMISIPTDLSVTERDTAESLHTPQAIKDELERLQLRKSALRIHAAREEAPVDNLQSRLRVITQAINKLQMTEPLSLLSRSNQHTHFKPSVDRGLASSRQVRNALTHH